MTSTSGLLTLAGLSALTCHMLTIPIAYAAKGALMTYTSCAANRSPAASLLWNLSLRDILPVKALSITTGLTPETHSPCSGLPETLAS